MGINFDQAAADIVSKERYTDLTIESLVFQSELLGMLPKNPKYGGKLYVGSMRNAVQSTVSASDTVAFTSGGPSQYVRWQVPWREGYASANLTGRAIDETNGDENAMVEAQVSEEDGAYQAIGIHLGSAIYGNGGGAIGQADNSTAYPVSGPTIRLTRASDIVNFYVGQVLNAAVSDDGTGGGNPIGGGTPVTAVVTAVDVDNYLVTIGGNWSTVFTGFTTNSYLFNQGDFASKVIGLQGWIPDDQHRANLSTAFNGVVRSNDPTRLAGHAYYGAGAPKGESIIQLLRRVQAMKGRPKHCFLNPADYADVVLDFEGRIQITTESAFKNPQIGFEGVKIATPYGNLAIYQDVFCPQGLGYLLDMSTWLMPSMGKVPKVATFGENGVVWLPNATANSFQKRFVYRAAIYCSAPGKNGVVRF